jgi:2-C-methyl-D-erythritol 4-phosphate cytidylyltransferase
MGGVGSRCSLATPKQFVEIQGAPLYLHTLSIFQKMNIFDQIVLVTHPEWVASVFAKMPEALVIGGAETRQGSSYLGLKALSPNPPDIVMIHDAVRPCVSEKIILDNLHGALRFGAVDTCIPSTDTIVHSPCGEKIQAIPLRKEFLRGQTPQTFLYPWIVEAHLLALQNGVFDASDDCQLLLRVPYPVHIVEGAESNFKITTNSDLDNYNNVINCLDKLIP